MNTCPQPWPPLINGLVDDALLELSQKQLPYFKILRGSVTTLFRWSWKILSYLVANLSKTLHISFYQNRSSIVEVMIKKFWCVFYASQCTSARQDACDSSTSADATPLLFDASFLENPCEYPHTLYLPETRVHKVRDSCYDMDLYVLFLRNCFRKPRKGVPDER